MSADGKPVEYYLRLEYSFNVIADPDGGYVIVFPDLPGCMTQVESLDEIPYMAEDVRIGWLETVYDTDPNGIPLPSYPADYGGEVALKLPKSLQRSLAESAEEEGVSLNEYVAMLLTRGEARRRRELRSAPSDSPSNQPQAAAV